MAFIISANPILDLTSVELVKSYSGCSTSASSRDTAIQLLVSSASLEFLKATGHVRDGKTPTGNPFLSPQSYDEWYDGNGNDSLYTWSWPISTVSLVEIEGYQAPESSVWSMRGYVIDEAKRSIVLRGMVFTLGVKNIRVQTTRGFSSTPLDVITAVTQIVSANLNRAEQEGVQGSSWAVSGRSGSLSFAGWTIPPQAARIIETYKARH